VYDKGNIIFCFIGTLFGGLDRGRETCIGLVGAEEAELDGTAKVDILSDGGL